MMPVVVLEGIEGTGKTTLAASLDGIIYRPLRPTLARLTAEELATWAELVVPVNTYVEDIYTADLLAILRPAQTIILDRSMPSGLVYSDMAAWKSQALHVAWETRMLACRAKLVLLTRNVEQTADRLGANDSRNVPAILAKTQANFLKLYSMCLLDKIQIDTTNLSSADVREQVQAFIRG